MTSEIVVVAPRSGYDESGPPADLSLNLVPLVDRLTANSSLHQLCLQQTCTSLLDFERSRETANRKCSKMESDGKQEPEAPVVCMNKGCKKEGAVVTHSSDLADAS